MSDFKIAHREQSSVNVLELKGYLDAHTAPKLEEAFQNLLKSQRFKIVVNCRTSRTSAAPASASSWRSSRTCATTRGTSS